MGVGAQDVMGRVAASIGDLESVAPEFQSVLDVPNGGVLFALPALLAMGLLKYTEQHGKFVLYPLISNQKRKSFSSSSGNQKLAAYFELIRVFFEPHRQHLWI